MSGPAERGSGGAGPKLGEVVRRADRLRRAGSLPQALEVLRALLAEHPLDARVHLEIGVTLAVWGRAPAEALPHFERAIELGPAMRSARLHRALALARLSRPAEALADLDWLEAARYRNSLMLYTLRAEQHAALGRWAEAEQDWTRALAQDATNPWLLEHRARARVALGRLGEARADLDAALEHQRRDEPRVDLELLEARAQVRGQLGDAEGALRDLAEAIGEAHARGEGERAERLERLRASRTAQTT